MSNTVFNKYAKYYDFLYKDKNYSKEVKFILDTLKRCGFKGKNILSLGCGTCTYEILLAQKGYMITGVDVSSQMLKVGREKINNAGFKDKIRIFKGDVRSLRINQKYDAIMCMFNVIGYQNSNQDLSDMLKSASKLLNKGGLFFFDFWHMPAVIADKPKNKIRRINANGNFIVRKTVPKLFLEKDLLQINFVVKSYKGKKLTDTTIETHTMRYFSLPELDYFFKTHGMEIEKVYNFLNLNSKIKDKEWNLYAVVRKI